VGRGVPRARTDIETNVTDVEGPRTTSLLSRTWSRDPGLRHPDREVQLAWWLGSNCLPSGNANVPSVKNYYK